MRIGVVYPQTELRGDPEAVRRIGDATERLGYDHLLAYDHVLGADHEDRDPPLMGPYTPDHPFHDPFVMFAYLAGRTERIEFVTGVVILPQRQTALLARQAADLDLLSGGRFRLGVGVGWNHVEYTALGQDFRTRGRRADEQIDLLRRLWTEPIVTHRGRFDTIERAGLTPLPTRSIPIWIGGFSEPAFARGARIGDGFIFGGGPTGVAGLERVRALLAEEGRDPATFGAEAIIPTHRGADDTVQRIEQWEAAGGTHASVVTMNAGLDSTDAHLDVIAKVSERLGRS